MLRILHTSDVQLDAPFRFLGSKGHRHRQKLREVLRRVIDLAIEGEFDLLLIAGDLFNDNRPRQDTIEFVVSQLGRLRIPACILPGNHDCYDAGSVYRKARFSGNVVIFTQQPTVREFAEMDVAVYGNPILSRQSRVGPLRGLARTAATRWHIAMAHGNIVRPDIPDPPRPIQPAEIAASGMDYVALGDWHAFADYSQGGVKAFYAGAPEPTALDQRGAGYVACVELDERGVRVRPERVGTIKADEMSVDLSGKPRARILEEIGARADPNLVLRVSLCGLADLGQVLDAEELAQELAPSFYHVECRDQSHPQTATISPDSFPEQLVVGKFIRLMQERIQRASDDTQRRRAERALQLGVALLEGRRVL